jgi:hypothetical protein
MKLKLGYSNICICDVKHENDIAYVFIMRNIIFFIMGQAKHQVAELQGKK